MNYEIVKKFEREIAQYAGSKHAVAVSSGTNALFLCLQYIKPNIVSIPCFTYPGVACSIKHAGAKINFLHKEWHGIYCLAPHNIYDSALRFRRDMYIKGSFYCLSFHWKKHLPIGRGGMILCDDTKAYKWFKRARFDGREECPLQEDTFTQLGWNMYLTPEQAQKGLDLFNQIKDMDLYDLKVKEQGYPDLSKYEVFTK